jgi:hypothetical protein
MLNVEQLESNKNKFISNHNFIKEYYHKGFALKYFKDISNKTILNKKFI